MNTSKQRRRISFLEPLENRTVLSSVSVSYGFSTGPITITADPLNNNFQVEEFKQAGATFVRVSSMDGGATKINGADEWTSLAPVTNITIKHLSSTQTDVDHVVFTGSGELQTTKNVTITANKTNLTYEVSDVNNPGNFKLTTKGQLDLSMVDSQWNSLTVDQSGCCPADVYIAGTTVNGAVTVKEGWGNGSSIVVEDSDFGKTVLEQYSGQKFRGPNCDGDGDLISVSNTTVLTLAIDQCDDGDAYGDDNTVVVQSVGVAQNNSSYFGITICQGNGEDATATVDDVYVFGTPNFRRGQPGPCAGISIEQGNGNSAEASITNSTVPGDVTITQGNGNEDEAYISGVVAGLANQFYCGAIIIEQGDGKGNYAEIVESSTAELEVEITQGDGEGDNALIDGVDSGSWISITQGAVVPTGPADSHSPNTATVSNSTADGYVYITQNDTAASTPGNTATIDTVEAGGSICITQGDADGDTAEVLSSIADGDIMIEQGDGDGNTATVDSSETTIWSYGDIYITQGDGNDATATISSSIADGNICITQGDGDTDSAVVENSEAYGYYIMIEQGDGHSAYARVELAYTPGNIKVTQGDGCEDVVEILGVEAGSLDPDYGWPVDVNGDVVVKQGDGYHNVVNVDESGGVFNMINNLAIYQGTSLLCPPDYDCEPGLSNEIYVNDSDITSDITIRQGYVWVGDGEDGGYWAEGEGVGSFLVEIGTSSPVYAGGETSIKQAGTGNSLVLNDFTTTWLDVWMGSGGLATATVSNTEVVYGPLYGEYTIDAGVFSYYDEDLDEYFYINNSFYDGGGNDGVTVSDTFDVFEL